MEFYDVAASRSRCSRSLVLLGGAATSSAIAAGLQDRVDPGLRGARLHGLRPRAASGIVHGLPCYRYEPLDPALLPPLYRRLPSTTLSEPTEVFHNDIRERFNRGDAGRRRARCSGFAELAAAARDGAAGRRRRRGWPRLIDANFDTAADASTGCRRGRSQMVETARGVRRQREVRRLGRRDRRDLPGRGDVRATGVAADRDRESRGPAARDGVSPDEPSDWCSALFVLMTLGLLLSSEAAPLSVAVSVRLGGLPVQWT